MILYRFHSVLGPPLQSLQSRLQSADLIMTGGKNLYKHNPQMLIFTSLINIKIPRSQCKDRQLPHYDVETLLHCALCRLCCVQCAGRCISVPAHVFTAPLPRLHCRWSPQPLESHFWSRDQWVRRANTGHGASENSSAGARKWTHWLLLDRGSAPLRPRN